jgi:hypothetical protein
VLAWGVDLEQAYLRLELVEHLAAIAAVAAQLGGARRLSEAALPALLEARARAGLGPRRRAASPGAPSPGAPSPAAPHAAERPTVVACAPPPSDAPVAVYDPKRSRATTLTTPGPELATLIREEIARALKG